MTRPRGNMKSFSKSRRLLIFLLIVIIKQKLRKEVWRPFDITVCYLSPPLPREIRASCYFPYWWRSLTDCLCSVSDWLFLGFAFSRAIRSWISVNLRHRFDLVPALYRRKRRESLRTSMSSFMGRIKWNTGILTFRFTLVNNSNK